jgi:hypothetical protein
MRVGSPQSVSTVVIVCVARDTYGLQLSTITSAALVLLSQLCAATFFLLPQHMHHTHVYTQTSLRRSADCAFRGPPGTVKPR